MPTRILSFDEVIDGLIALKRPHFSNYLAMYSSWYGGIILDPALMTAPIDDHLVHRGDGIFEAFSCINWNIYALDPHLDRLYKGAEAIDLPVPESRSRLVEIIRETIRAGNSGNCLVRLFVSRGPGGFSPNPYESVGSQLYIVITAPFPPATEKYESGVILRSSAVPVKTDYFARLKTCNYLPNVLMKKEAVDAGVDFTVSIDENGFIAEGATENVGIATKNGRLLIPRFRRVLKGITVTRAIDLASVMVGNEIREISEADITPEQAYAAAEMFVFGTTVNILPVVEYDGHKIGGGFPGPVFKKLLALFVDDEQNNRQMLTPVTD